MEYEDVVTNVISYCDLQTVDAMRQVCKMYYRLSGNYWDNVFYYNAANSYSPLYRSHLDAMLLAVKKNDIEYLVSELQETEKDTVCNEASHLGRYNVFDAIIKDPLCLFYAKLGSALINCDIEMIERLYENISEDELKLIQHRKDSLILHTASCKDLRVAVSMLVNFPYVLPLVDTETLINTISESHRLLRYTLRRASLTHGYIDNANILFEGKDSITSGMVDGATCIESIKWVQERYGLEFNNLLFELLCTGKMDCVEYLTVTCPDRLYIEYVGTSSWDEGDTPNESVNVESFSDDDDDTECPTESTTEYTTDKRLNLAINPCLVHCFTNYDTRAIEWILSVAKDKVDWRFVFSMLCLRDVVGYIHLFTKYADISDDDCIEIVPAEPEPKPCIYVKDTTFDSVEPDMPKDPISNIVIFEDGCHSITYDEMMRYALNNSSSEVIKYVISYCQRHTTIDWEWLRIRKIRVPIDSIHILSKYVT